MFMKSASAPPKLFNDLLSIPYDGQIIINFVDENLFAKILKNRWDERFPKETCAIIKGNELLSGTYKNRKLSSEKKLIRVYIIIHGSLINNAFMDNASRLITPEELAKSLSEFIFDSNVIINLISCWAARSTNFKGATNETAQEYLKKDTSYNSLAARLHEAIAKEPNAIFL